jgi:hypothetical protein
MYESVKEKIKTKLRYEYLKRGPNPFSRTIALGPAQPLTEVSGIFLGVKGGRRVRLTTSQPSMREE